MSNYSQITAFTPKDSLSTGNPAKVIKGSDFDAEFAAISTAIISKADDSTVTAALDTKTTGPASSTDNTLPRFDGTTGKLLQGSGVVVDDSGNLTVNAGTLGYGAGAGGTVTQITSKGTAVTLNKPSGTITMNGAALASGSQVTFAMNNTFVTAIDALAVSIDVNSFAAFSYALDVCTAAGVAYFTLTNNTGLSRTDAVRINFAVIKGSNT